MFCADNLLALTSPAVGLSEAELKPAFLMLSSCHTDLSRTVASEMAGEHALKAQEYLRKVYGAHTPVVSPSGPQDTNSHGGHLANTSNTERHSPSIKKRMEAEGHVRILERECQSLRDRYSQTQTQLAAARVARRNAQDALEGEQDARRKLEGELEDAVRELGAARRGEKAALEQCRREVDSRRRADERAVGLREEAAGLKRQLEGCGREAGEREGRAREAFGHLAQLFARAAQGEDLAAVVKRALPPQIPPTPHTPTPRRERVASGTMRSDDRSGHT